MMCAIMSAGDAETEYELKRLDRLPAELPALIQCPDSECGMHQARGVEQDRDRQELPEQGMEINASRQRLHRDIAECVIEEMADHISEQHHAAGKTDLPEADAAEPTPSAVLGKRRPCDPFNNYGDSSVLFPRGTTDRCPSETQRPITSAADCSQNLSPDLPLKIEGPRRMGPGVRKDDGPPFSPRQVDTS